MKKIELGEKVITENERIALRNRERFLKSRTLVINFVSSPGSGKTSLIEHTVRQIGKDCRVLVLTGDLMTQNDAERVRRHGVEAYQITTHDACHLTAKMVDEKIGSAREDNYDIIMVENVGNLVCPASFDLGEDFKVLLISCGEGDDKPLKYPPMVRASEVLVVNKIDLQKYVDSKPDLIVENALKIKPELKVFKISCKDGTGIEGWIKWLKSRLQEKQAAQKG